MIETLRLLVPHSVTAQIPAAPEGYGFDADEKVVLDVRVRLEP